MNVDGGICHYQQELVAESLGFWICEETEVDAQRERYARSEISEMTLVSMTERVSM